MSPDSLYFDCGDVEFTECKWLDGNSTLDCSLTHPCNHGHVGSTERE